METTISGEGFRVRVFAGMPVSNTALQKHPKPGEQKIPSRLFVLPFLAQNLSSMLLYMGYCQYDTRLTSRP